MNKSQSLTLLTAIGGFTGVAAAMGHIAPILEANPTGGLISAGFFLGLIVIINRK
jgi:hypothetical protein